MNMRNVLSGLTILMLAACAPAPAPTVVKKKDPQVQIEENRSLSYKLVTIDGQEYFVTKDHFGDYSLCPKLK